MPLSPHGPDAHVPDEPPAVLPLLVEALASAAAAGIALFLPLLQFGAYFCFGGGCGPDPGAIHLYRVLVAVLAATAVTALILAVRRRARGMIRWHAAIALAGAASAVLFAIPAIDWAELRRDDPPPLDPSYVPCYSGSNDCVGG
ncbi:DUF6234 family protein [Nocardioides nitrophenolicus]|uniref:DUF6234 family protein n=1 Tax=Nocardioides nitrophenolicus TaxID=60489 RepID=UPI001959B742|nr:DUF6234 family protein [Nocardioides nitrophenolicus]MBM7519315.1 hypothetical protein [Nocardioides nitrophenolicus]